MGPMALCPASENRNIGGYIMLVKKLSLCGAVALGIMSSFAMAADVDVDQVGQRFSTGSVSIKKGDKVLFKNSDDVTHNINIFDADDNPDDKGLQKPGEIVAVLFDKAGTFSARCAIHPKMKMTISVN